MRSPPEALQERADGLPDGRLGLRRIVDLRQPGQSLVACVQPLERTHLADDASITCWLQELERAAWPRVRELQTRYRLVIGRPRWSSRRKRLQNC
jgi:hypothetical protein